MNFLKQNVLQPGGSMGRFEWFGVIPNDTLIDDILKPGWWLHYAGSTGRMKPFQIIELVTEDMMLDIELRVLKVSEGLVYVRPLRIFEDDARAGLQREVTEAVAANASAADVPDWLKDDYKVGFSPNAKWYATLKKANQVIKSGFKAKTDAVAYCIEHAGRAGMKAPAETREQVAA